MPRDFSDFSSCDVCTADESCAWLSNICWDCGWTHKHSEQLHIVMNDISDRDPYVEGSRNKHWWHQVEAGVCSAMQHTISIRTLKHRAKLLDVRGVQQMLMGFFESSARGEAAYDSVKAAERAHDDSEAKAVENVANLRTTGQLQTLATCIDKLDSLAAPCG